MRVRRLASDKPKTAVNTIEVEILPKALDVYGGLFRRCSEPDGEFNPQSSQSKTSFYFVALCLWGKIWQNYF